MGLRFRKSIKVLPGIKLNLSKSGIGVSGGIKGLRVGVNSRGTYSSVGIPGTGIYSTSYKSNSKKTIPSNIPTEDLRHKIKTKTRTWVFWLTILSIFCFISQPILGICIAIISFVLYKFLICKSLSYKAKKQLKQAINLYKKNEYKNASNLFEESCENFPNDKAIAFYAALSFSESGQHKKAVEMFTKYLETYPQDYSVLKLLAISYLQLGDEDSALKVFQSFPQEETNNTILLAMAAILSNKKLYDSAIEVLKRAPIQKRNLFPELAEVIYQLGCLYEQVNNRTRANSLFARVYAYDSNYKDIASKISNG